MPKFTDRERMDALIEVADQIEDASIVAEQKDLSFSVTVERSGEVKQSFDVIDNEPFRSFAMSVRLAYQNDEPANFGAVCSVLHKIGSAEVREAAAQLRDAYNNIVNGQNFAFHLHGDFEGTVVHNRQILETWLYGKNFHQDKDRKAMYAELQKFGPRLTLALQDIVMRLAQLIINLASVVEFALKEQESASSPAVE